MGKREDGSWRNVIYLGFVSLFTDISSEMIFAILPLYMVMKGMGGEIIGAAEGFAEAIANVLKIFSGWLSDKVRKRKPLVIAGYSLSAVVKPLFAYARTGIEIALIRVGERVGKGIRTTPRDVIIALSTREKKRGRAYGVHRMMDTTGAVIGPLLSFFLLPLFSYESIFLFSLIPASIAIVILILLVREPEGEETSFSSGGKFSHKFLLFMIPVAVIGLASFSYAFILLRSVDFVSQDIAPLLYLLINISYAIFAYPIGLLGDRIGLPITFSLPYVSLMIVSYGFMNELNILFVILLLVLYGLYKSSLDTLGRAISSVLSAKGVIGRGMGLYHLTLGLLMLTANMIAGYLWSIDHTLPFLYALIIAAIGLVILVLYVRWLSKAR